MISFKQYQKYEKIQPAYLRKLDFAYDDMEYWLDFAETAKPLAVYRSKADMIAHTKKLNKAKRIKKDYQAWVKKIEKAESNKTQATKGYIKKDCLGKRFKVGRIEGADGGLYSNYDEDYQGLIFHWDNYKQYRAFINEYNKLLKNNSDKIKNNSYVKEYQILAYKKVKTKAESKPKSTKSTKPKEAKTMATRAQKNKATKLLNLRKTAGMIGCVVKAKSGRGKSKNTRYYKKIKKGVYQYTLRNR